MARDIFAWAPLIALVCGVFASLGLFRSTKRAFGLGLVLTLLQMAAWTATLMLVGGRELTTGDDWNPDFVVSFFWSLIVVIPFTIIGATLGGAIIWLLRYSSRRRAVAVRVPRPDPESRGEDRRRG